MRYLLLLASVLLFSSCATIFNNSHSFVQIKLYPENSKLIINEKDTVTSVYKKLYVSKNKPEVKLKVISESGVDSIILKRRLSSAYLVGNILSPAFSGYLIDMNSDKRYSYPGRIDLDTRYPFSSININRDGKAGHWLSGFISVPFGNNFVTDSPDGRVSYYGGTGLTFSLDLDITHSMALSLYSSFAFTYDSYNLSLIGSNDFPEMYVNNISQGIRVVHYYDRWRFAYGPVLSTTTTKERDYDFSSSTERIETEAMGLALSTSAHYRLIDDLYLGCNLIMQSMPYKGDLRFGNQTYFGWDLAYRIPVLRLNK